MRAEHEGIYWIWIHGEWKVGLYERRGFSNIGDWYLLADECGYDEDDVKAIGGEIPVPDINPSTAQSAEENKCTLRRTAFIGL